MYHLGPMKGPKGPFSVHTQGSDRHHHLNFLFHQYTSPWTTLPLSLHTPHRMPPSTWSFPLFGTYLTTAPGPMCAHSLPRLMSRANPLYLPLKPINPAMGTATRLMVDLLLTSRNIERRRTTHRQPLLWAPFGTTPVVLQPTLLVLRLRVHSRYPYLQIFHLLGWPLRTTPASMPM